ncbi:subtilisin-like protease SBT3.9 isoform X2 [Brachypodium distachyon]|uniref:Subtilisin-like protease n=1 Tax=Brachypodium distachyon TaxID=15368 RepID=A0A2K2CWB8_BRADI|nr:subtilisin-like protease SBT3.9 isoform X2 [Brachypodium distachyon]PNT66315.1 hypothetical protein BRADI_3g10030v3 [Brachypodium distachyon]|eukprot:XP_003572330.1 subtilisin-like protease SBT3.9 isoform X2 [Brachypodium distachyon]
MDLRSAFCSALLLSLLLLPLSANASSKVYIVYMGQKQHDDPSEVTVSHHDVLTSVLGSKDEALKSIVYSYRHGFSGFAAMLTESQAEILAKLPEVISVRPNTYHKAHTTRSWDFLGMDYYKPPQESGLLQKAKYGEDVIIGVVDSGIWPESRSFDDTGYGPVPARWKGTCQVGEAFNVTSCNRKIIGARWYSKDVDADSLKGEYMSPRDLKGHGTHVASTIAGGQVWNESYNGLAAGVARGGAPRARLAIYKVLWGQSGTTGGGTSAGILKAIDDAINDGVDVLSLSLGGSSEFMETLHAVERGISVVFAAGNYGPMPQTVQNAVPWVTTVAASTIDRSFPTLMTFGNNEKLVGQSFYSGNSSDFQELVWIGTLDGGTSNVTGKIILFYAPTVMLSTPPRDALGAIINITVEARAKGLIFAQYTANNLDSVTACKGTIPCVLVDFEMARRIIFYMQTSTRTPVVKVSPTMTVTGNGVLSPRVAAFSSRGPSETFPAILKPDVAAPGVSILAANGDSYAFNSGTSMACPHVSAVTALLKSVYPHWSPAMIKSAIVTTASVVDRFGMPIQAEGVPRKVADPFDFGGGHMNPDRAADPGLVYDMDAREYSKNCTSGSKVKCQYQLNLPSIAVPDLKDFITVQRTVTNVGQAEATYWAAIESPAGVDMSVEPSVIKFTKDGSRNATFRVAFKARQRVQGGYTFGSLTWLDDSTHSVRIPIAVRTVIQDLVADVA